MYLFYALILLIPMLALRKRAAGDPPILDQRSTTCIKGVLCFYVMLHNLGLELIGNTPLKETVCERSGGVGVGLFFFLSAFGIIRSYQAKGNKSLRRLLLVHTPRLYIISVLINLLTYLSFFKDSLEPRDAWMQVFNLDMFNDFHRMNLHGWYITTILGMYLIFAAVFYVASKFKSDKKFIIAAIILGVIALCFRIGVKIFEQGSLYTREMPAFTLGCLYAAFYDKVNAFSKKFFIPGMIVALGFFIWGFFFISEPMATYAACALLVLVSQKVTYYNKITYFFGKICIGVYLFLHLSTLILQSFVYNEYLWVLINAAFVIELSVLLYAVEYAIAYVIRKIKNRLQGRRITASENNL